MSSPKVYHDTKTLPKNILTLVDDDFYHFVEQRLGAAQAMLLKIQQISSVPCFLLSDDPCEVLNLNIDDDELNDLKRKMCFIMSDGSCYIKPGVKTGFKCLNELLSKETDQKLKQSRNTKMELPTLSSVNILTPSSSILTSSITTTISTQQPTLLHAPERTIITSSGSQQPTTPSGSQQPTTSSGSQQPTTASGSQQPTKTPTPHEISPAHVLPSASISEHRKYLLNLLKQWCHSHKNEFNLESFDLKDGKDFMLYVKRGANDVIEASIKCNCGRLISLTVKDGNFQLSNYQKHLRTKSCTHMNSLKENGEAKQMKYQQTANELSSSNSVASAPLVASQQQTPALQTPLVRPIDSSSVLNPLPSDTQSATSQTNIRKRSQPASQSSSQKAKRHRG